jgi:hypothetical protein
MLAYVLGCGMDCGGDFYLWYRQVPNGMYGAGYQFTDFETCPDRCRCEERGCFDLG